MSRKAEKYKAAIIGAGKIGAFFDAPEEPAILTHAHAYRANPRTELVGFFDTDSSKSNEAAKLWQSSAFSSIEELFNKGRPDIVSICTPDETHFGMLEQVLLYKPKMVICEKPVTSSAAETEKIVGMYEEANVPLLINYSRRFDTFAKNIKKEIAGDIYGKVVNASALYTKGLLHNGSHVIDLARFFFGEALSLKALYSKEDYKKEDKTIDAFISFENCPAFHLIGADKRNYSIFEFDILFQKARIRFIDAGYSLEHYSARPDPMYKEYVSLGEPVVSKTDLTKALLKMTENAVDHLESAAELLSTGKDALETQKICESLIKQIQ